MIRFYTFITILILLIVFLYAKTENRNLLTVLFVVISSILILLELRKLRYEDTDDENYFEEE